MATTASTLNQQTMGKGSEYKKKPGYDRPLNYFQERHQDPENETYTGSIYDLLKVAEESRIYGLSNFNEDRFLDRCKNELGIHIKITQRSVFLMGEIFYVVRKILKPKGKFQKFIGRLPISIEHAYDCIHVYEYCFGFMDIALLVPLHILYTVAAPNCPDELRDYLFEKGGILKIKNDTLKQLVKKCKEEGFESIQAEVERFSDKNQTYYQTQRYFAVGKEIIKGVEGGVKKFGVIELPNSQSSLDFQTVQAQKISKLITEGFKKHLAGMKAVYEQAEAIAAEEFNDIIAIASDIEDAARSPFTKEEVA